MVILSLESNISAQSIESVVDTFILLRFSVRMLSCERLAMSLAEM